MFRFAHLIFIFTLLFTCAPFGTANAQEPPDMAAIQTEIQDAQIELEAFEPILLDTTINDEQLFETRQSVNKMKVRFYEIKELITPLMQSAKAELTDLGLPPAEDSTDIEPANIRDLRERLNKEVLMIQGIITQTDALKAKSTRFLERLAAIRRSQFVEKILQNYMSPFNASLWQEASRDKDLALGAIINSIEKGWSQRTDENKAKLRNSLLMSIIAFFCIFFTTTFVNTRGLRRHLAEKENVPLNENLSLIGRATIYSMLAGFAGLSILYLTIDSQGIVDEYNKTYVNKIFFVSLFILYALTQSWMLLKTRVVRRVVCLLTFVVTTLFAVDLFLLEVGQYYGVPIELAIAQSFIVTTIFAALVLSFLLRRIKQKDDGRIFLIKRRAFFAGIGIGVFILLANALGYVALTRFVFEQSIILPHFFIAILILRAMIRPVLRWLEKLFYQKPDKDDHLLLFWMGLFVDTLLFMISIPIVAAIVGVEWEGIRLLIYQAISGFEVGGITISISNLAASIALFLCLMFLTRFVQKLLSEKILPKTRMDKSARISFVQIIGYVGLTVALMSAISSVGFDLSNLALIAGALSVGIGFGLQSIVSNFVSGLILLFERPIKVGDWVIVNSGEGIVKKISVRATEIETFNRTAIIIPNSELISASVKNWTHKDRIGRVVIPVGVAYSCDPHHIKSLLLEVASESDYVLSSPLPTVMFNDFGDSALLLELRVFIRNISDFYAISSEIRFAVWDKLKENNIEIPFPQRDLHIRSSDGLQGVEIMPHKP